MINSLWKRLLSGLLALVLVFSNVPVFSLAAAERLCPHHESHEDCGYREAVEGTPCTHECGEDCYETVTDCTHVHGDCGYAEAVEGTPCDHVHGNCGYAEAVAGIPCDHVHGDCGYAQAVEGIPCDHVHGDCGYAEATEEIPCDHVCGEECAEGCIHACGDGSCGFAAAIPGSDCTHSCGDGSCSYAEAVPGTECGHVCTDGTCAYAAAIPGSDCTHRCTDGTCAYSESSEAVPCGHECSRESGCMTAVPNCTHIHDEVCGYTEAVEAGVCQYVCQICEAEAALMMDEEEEQEDPPEVTRAQWIQALVETFSMTVEDDNYPDNYYSDLTGEEEYYRDIMVAVEFGVIDLKAGEAFRPEAAATREFAAQTLNFSLGFQLEEEQEYTYADYEQTDYPDDIQIAVNRQWFALIDGCAVPDQPITESEKTVMLEDAAAILEETSGEQTMEFASGVIELPSDTTIVQDADGSLIIYDAQQMLNTGDVFIAYEYGFPVALKATSVTGSVDAQTVTFTTEGTDGAITKLCYSGSIPVAVSDFVPAQASTFQLNGRQAMAEAATFSSASPKLLSVNRKVTLAPGVEASLNCSYSDASLDIEINTDKGLYSAVLNGTVSSVVDMNCDYLEGFGAPAEIHLGKVRFLYGTAYVDLTAQFALTGEMKVVMEADVSTGFSISDGNLRMIKSFRKKTFNFVSEINAQVGMTTELGLDVCVMNANVWASFGGKMLVYDIVYDEGTPKHCGDIKGHLYLDIGAAVSVIGIPLKEHSESVYTQENSPVRVAYHYEDGVRVTQCTRSEEPTYTTDPSSGNYNPGSESVSSTYLDKDGNEVTLWSYRVESDGYAAVYGYSGESSVLAIPSAIDGYTVKYIERFSFSKSAPRILTIPEGITEIRSAAFSGDTELQSVSIPDSVTLIGASAFAGCENMTLTRIPANVTKIGDGAFEGCKELSEFIVKDNAQLGSGVFHGCSMELKIQKKTGTISEKFLLSLCGIRKIEIEEGITEIGDYAFSGFDSDEWHFKNCKDQRSLCGFSIPSSVNTIGYSAFADCDGITDLDLSGECTLKHNAFYDCDGITSVNITGKTSVGSYAFAECDSLEEAIINYFVLDDYTNGTGSLQHNVGIFHHCDALESVTVLGERIDPYKVDEFCDIDIDDSVFSDCPKLKNLKLVDVEVHSVGTECFARSGISSITDYGWNLHMIGDGAFRDCADLTEVRIGWRADDTQERIGSGAFANCGNLKKVTFTANAAGIAADAFAGCTAKIYYPVMADTFWEYYIHGDTPWSESNMLNYGGNLSWVAYEPNRTEILNPPSSMTVPAGENIVISLDTVGDGLRYYWYVNGEFAPEIRGNSYCVTMSEAVHGQTVLCIIECFYGCSVGSDLITLSMGTPVTIDKQSASTAAFKGEQTSVSVQARGDDLTYTWYRKNQYKTWGEPFFREDTSQTGSSYTVTVGEDAQDYYDTVYSTEIYCVVTDRNGTSVTSETVTVTTKFKANITGYLSSVGVEPGQTATVTLEAEGDGLTYAWYYTSPTDYEHFKLAEEVTGNTYSHTINGPEDRQLVYCVVTDQYGNSVTSNQVMLDIAIPLQILRQPQSVTAPVGDEAVVSVLADGDRLKYTWFYAAPGSGSFAIVEGQNKSILSVTMTEDTNGARVYCMINDRLGRFAATDYVTLSAGEAGVRITKQPKDIYVDAGSNAIVSIQAAGDGLTYSWYYASGEEEELTYQPEFRGASFSVRMSEENGGSRVCCVVEDANGNFAVSDTVYLYLNYDLVITKQPESVRVPNGKTVQVSLEAQGDGLSYAWYYKNADSGTFTLTKTFTGNSYSCKMDDTRNGRQIYCVVTDAYGNSVQSDTVTLSMGNTVKITQQPQSARVPEGIDAAVSIQAEGDGLSYRWYFMNAGGSKFYLTNSFTGSDYTVQMNEARNGRQVYCIVTDAYGNSVQSDTVTISMAVTAKITEQPKSVTVPEGANAVVSIRAEGDGLTYKWYYKEAGGSKFYVTNSFKGSSYTVQMNEARNGRQIYCVITDSYGNSVRSDTVTIAMGTALKITSQPRSVTVAEGKTAKVTVGVQGDGLSYKWYFKNAGASKFSVTNSFKSNTYSVTMDQSRSGRQIYCVITDAYGNTVTTETVTVSMGTGLKITVQPKSVTVAEGTKAVVSVQAAGNGLTYQWYYKEAGGSKFYLTNSFKGSSYTVQMNAARNGRQVYCVITDSSGNQVKSDTVTLSMKTALKITKQPVSVTVASGSTAKVTLTAQGDSLSYAWYFKNPGASKFILTTTFTGNSYSTKMDASRAGRQIYCVITDQYGDQVKSNTVTLNMK